VHSLKDWDRKLFFPFSRQFHQHYTRAFFIRTSFWHLFSRMYIHRKKLPKWRLYKKRARITLMKLMLGWNEEAENSVGKKASRTDTQTQPEKSPTFWNKSEFSILEFVQVDCIVFFCLVATSRLRTHLPKCVVFTYYLCNLRKPT